MIFIFCYGEVIKKDSMERRVAVVDTLKKRILTKLQEIIIKYDLPKLETILHNPPTKKNWSKLVTS
jgi:hypothetical protein